MKEIITPKYRNFGRQRFYDVSRPIVNARSRIGDGGQIHAWPSAPMPGIYLTVTA